MKYDIRYFLVGAAGAAMLLLAIWSSVTMPTFAGRGRPAVLATQRQDMRRSPSPATCRSGARSDRVGHAGR